MSPPSCVLRCSFRVSHAQFYLEPVDRDYDPDEVHWQEAGQSEQGFSAFRYSISLGTPEEDDRCDVEVYVDDQMPPTDQAVQAVVVPLVVKPGGLCLYSLPEHPHQHPFDVPPGKYHVVACFFPTETPPPADPEDLPPKTWRVTLTFLPRGIVRAKCIKLNFGTPPKKLVLYR